MKRALLQLWGALPLPRWLRWLLVLAGVHKFPIGVTAAIRDDANRLLFFRHTYRGPYPWGLPSGWLKSGEPPDLAIAREIHEETGLQVADVQLLLARSGQDLRRLDLVYTCRLAGGSFRPSAEVDAMQWFSPDDFPPMMESQCVMIADILANLDKSTAEQES